jgi:hypothetical protein
LDNILLRDTRGRNFEPVYVFDGSHKDRPPISTRKAVNVELCVLYNA